MQLRYTRPPSHRGPDGALVPLHRPVDAGPLPLGDGDAPGIDEGGRLGTAQDHAAVRHGVPTTAGMNNNLYSNIIKRSFEEKNFNLFQICQWDLIINCIYLWMQINCSSFLVKIK